MTRQTGQTKEMNMKFWNENQEEEYCSIMKITQRFYEQMGMVIIGCRDRWWAPVSVKFKVAVVQEAVNSLIS